MNYYFDIQILSDPDFPIHQILSVVYNRLHSTLVRLEQSQIGVSFPEYQLMPRGLGSKVRAHGSKEDLEKLLAEPWLQTGLRDHVEVSKILSIPTSVKYRFVSRAQPKLNVERLVRRYQRRHNLSYEEAVLKYEGVKAPKTSLPFIRLRSESTDQGFALFVKQGDLLDQPQMGTFTTYALSADATVPWF